MLKVSVRPVMMHFFYMDEADPTKVRRWVGSPASSRGFADGTSPRRCVSESWVRSR
jgi:hypothetical protein